VILPPPPVHVIAYVVVAVGETILVPVVDTVVVSRVQVEALSDVHESVEDCPSVIVVGDAISESVGAGVLTFALQDAFVPPFDPRQLHV
jgi:hypothetical protein